MTNEELYQKYITGDEDAFEQLYLQLQKFILSVAAEAQGALAVQTRIPSMSYAPKALWSFASGFQAGSTMLSAEN